MNVINDFLYANLGEGGPRVFRLGLSGSYRPGENAIRAGIDAGVNYLFGFPWDRQMTRVLREVLPSRREEFVVATGATNLLGTRVLRKAIENSLKRLCTDYIDVFHCFWVPGGHFDQRTYDTLSRFKQEGKIRQIAISTHDRRYAGRLVASGYLDVLMMRYNAAHRGAESDIFPYLAAHKPGVVGYTATRWGKLLKRPKRWSSCLPVPSAADCYRFVLTSPHVHVCLTAPRTRAELEANLRGVSRGPLDEEMMAFMKRFGDKVHGRTAEPPR